MKTSSGDNYKGKQLALMPDYAVLKDNINSICLSQKYYLERIFRIALLLK